MKPVLLALVSLLLLSCARHPAPAPVQGAARTDTVFVPQPGETTQDTILIPVESSSFDYRALHRSIDSALSVQDTALAVALLRLQVQGKNSLDDLGRRSLQLVEILRKQGRVAEAGEVLDAFLVYKPRIQEWLDSAERMERLLRGEQVQQIQDMQPLVKQISNFTATMADYGLVRELTDSLRSMRIPDSLRRWSISQDSLALRRTLARLQPQIDSVHRWVRERGDYVRAKASGAQLAQLRTELASALGVDSLLAWVARQEQKEKENQNPQFWKGKDPQKVLQEAQQLRLSGNEERSLFLLRQLMGTPLRKQAVQEMQILGEAYCQNRRQSAALAYAKARKESGVSAKSNVQQAVSALNQCLEEFPDYSQHSKVRQNRDLLMQELQESKP